MGVTYTSAIRLMNLVAKNFPEAEEITSAILSYLENGRKDGKILSKRIVFLGAITEDLFNFAVARNISIKTKELDLINFPYYLGGINTCKLDAWLHNKLLFEPNRIGMKDPEHMSGIEKLEEYTGKNKLFSRIVMGGRK